MGITTLAAVICICVWLSGMLLAALPRELIPYMWMVNDENLEHK
jgi:hypothetical protein